MIDLDGNEEVRGLMHVLARLRAVKRHGREATKTPVFLQRS